VGTYDFVRRVVDYLCLRVNNTCDCGRLGEPVVKELCALCRCLSELMYQILYFV